MADARGLTLVLLLVAGVATATSPCEEDRGQTGLALAQGATKLTVAAVDDGSAAAGAGVRAGDEVVQVNGVVPKSCADYARAVREARHDRKALLVLVQRASTDVALALGSATWDVAVAAPPPTIPAPAPSVRPLVAAAPPPPLPSVAQVSLDEVLQGLAALTPGGERPPAAGLEGYRRAVTRLHEQVSTLRARQTVGPEVAGGLATVLAYHDAAMMAWAADETEGERTHRPRQLPAAQHTAPYFADSEVATTIDRFPFLRDTVTRDPGPGVFGGEAAGVWHPLQARALLWEHARSEQGMLSSWLGSK
jgi:membrane-associated protease RseP (regulator of RpoE activity)